MEKRTAGDPLRPTSARRGVGSDGQDEWIGGARAAAGVQLLHLASGDLWAGAEVQIFQLLRALARDGLSPEAVLFNDLQLAEKLRNEGIRVQVLPESEWGVPRILLALIRLLRDRRPQLLHTHGLKANVLGGSAAKVVGIPSVRTVHSRPGGGLVTRLDHLSARFLQNALVSVSNELTPLLKSRYGAKVYEIENGLAVAELNALAGKKRGDGRVHVGFAGRLVPVKRVDLFLGAAKTLISRTPGRYLFHVYGEGAERARAQGMSAGLGIGDHVRFEGFQNELAPHLASLDLLVMPSDHEGLPMVMLEALALGVPVVAHAAGGMVRVLDITGGGRLVQNHTADGYADAIEELLADVRNNPGFSRRVRERLTLHYDVSRTAREYSAFYDLLLEGA